MKTVKKNVYYCDYCNKRNLSGGVMKKHESRCTANPDRVCGFCEISQGVSPNIRELVVNYKSRFTVDISKIDEGEFWEQEIETVKWIGEPITLAEIRKEVNDCPNCIFAIIRQCKFNYHYFDELGFKEFDYKKELAVAWSEHKPDSSNYDTYRY